MSDPGSSIIDVKQPFTFRGAVVKQHRSTRSADRRHGHGHGVDRGAVSGDASLAPGCRIVVGTGEYNQSRLRFAARDIELQPGVRVVFRPSSELRPGLRPSPLKDDFVGTTLSPAWRTFDAGSPAGSTQVTGQLRITGGGPGLAGTKDGVRFLHQPSSGDVDLAVQVASVGASTGSPA